LGISRLARNLPYMALQIEIIPAGREMSKSLTGTTGVHFENLFTNWCLFSDKLCELPEKHGGSLSTKDGNVSVKHIEVREKPERVRNLNKLEEY
jgi:hypothetical protein